MKTTLFACLLPASLLAQGDLAPPAGAPAAGMKTLEQMEPRIPVQKLAAAPPYTISASGSYYLTGNITVADGNAINIIVGQGGVTLDMNGYTISSTHPSGSGTAISIYPSSSASTIFNGHIFSGTTYSAPNFTSRGFSGGIVAQSGVASHQVRDVTVTGVSGLGINLGFHSLVSNCSVKTVMDTGIIAGTVTGSRAHEIGGTGILAGTVSDSSATSVDSGGQAGIAGETVENCTGTSKGGAGIAGGNVRGCTGISTGSSPSLVDKSYGISATWSVSDSRGTSTNSWGVYSSNGNVTNCYGISSNSSLGGGIFSPGTVSFSRGYCTGGTAISAFNAIGCSAVAGTVTATNKSLGTP
ncbi:MAG: hypothetical protein EOP85_00005 [Verrucomicrobiaceae bacterium]|nr:MAG: hypothetical protein EOP85_00005 [Verrucomicrobiaceae bacterium]